MVCDDLQYASEYFNLHDGIRTALEFLRQADLASMAPGRHDVDGDRVFALVSEYDTRDASETFWEAHRLHVDVQFVHSGHEQIAVGRIDRFVVEHYDAARDLVVARGSGDQRIAVGPGQFVILFPHDVHMPGLVGAGTSRVRKVVMKVRRD